MKIYKSKQQQKNVNIQSEVGNSNSVIAWCVISVGTHPSNVANFSREDFAEGLKCRLTHPGTQQKQKQKFKGHLNYMGRKSIY